MKKIAIYLVSQGDLGHHCRVYNIVKYLLLKYKAKIKIYLLEAGLRQDCIRFPSNVTCIHLPYCFYNKWRFRGMEILRKASHMEERIRFLLRTLEKIKPHIFITEFFPFGRINSKYELIPAIEYLKSKKVKIFASIGYPYFAYNDIELLNFLCNLYDKIFIHTPPYPDFEYFCRYINKEKRISIKAFRNFFNSVREKIYFTGYILPPQIFNSSYTDSNSSNLILVCRGGGAFYPRIVTLSISTAKCFSDKFKFKIIAGPSTSNKEKIVFERNLKVVNSENIEFTVFESNFVEIIRNCALFIGTSGYNNYVQLLYLRKKAILIPFVGYSQKYYFSEQLIHALILKDFISSTILHYFSLSSDKLAHYIKRKLKEEVKINKDIREEWFKGGEIFANILMNL